MDKKAKVIISIFSVVIGCVVIAILVLWLAKAAILSSYLSHKLSMPLSLKELHLKKGHIEIKDFVVRNPKRYKEKHALNVKEIDLYYSEKEWKQKPKIINELVFEHVDLGIICKDFFCRDSNWTEITKNNLNTKTKKKNREEIIINTVIINHLTVKIRADGEKEDMAREMHIHKITLHNVSSKTGFPTDQLIMEIFVKAGLKNYIKGILDTKSVFDRIEIPFIQKTGKNKAPSRVRVPYQS